MGRVVHYDVPVDQPERAATFYREALGWTVERWGQADYWPMRAEDTGDPHGADGALTLRVDAPEGVLIHIQVDDIRLAAKRVEGAGGTVETDVMPIPAIGWSAHVRDTEGNLIGLFQPDPTVPPPEVVLD